MSLLGQLAVSIIGDTAQLKKTFKEIGDQASALQTDMQKLGKRVGDTGKTMIKWVTGPIATVGGGLLAIAQKTANAGDEIQKMALRTGFSAEALSEYKHAAELSGTSLESLEKGVKRMQKVLFDAEKGLSTANDAIDALGLSLEDLQGLSPEQQFDKLAMSIASIEDPSRRAALAQEIFGRAGTEMLPMLAAGADGIAQMRQEARDLGIVFSQEAADVAAQFNDDMDRLRKALGGVFQELGMKLIPIMTEEFIPAIKENVIPLIREFGEKIGNLIEWFSNLDPQWQKVIVAAGGFLAVLGPLLVVLGTVISSVSALAPVFVALTGPIGLAVAAVAGLIAIGITLYKNWDKVKYFAVQAWGYIKMVVLDAIHSMLIGLEKFTSFIPILNAKVTEAREKVGRMIDHERITLSARKAVYEMVELENQIRSTTENVTKQVPALNSNIKSMFSAVDAANSMAKAQGELAKKTDEATKALARLDARTREWVKRVGYPTGKSKEYLRQLGAAMKLEHELKLDIDYSKIGIPISQEKLPKFAAGGIVPGPIGKPQLAVVHGGEEIIPAGRSAPKTANITIYLDGRQIARAIGQPLTDEVRIRTGVKI